MSQGQANQEVAPAHRAAAAAATNSTSLQTILQARIPQAIKRHTTQSEVGPPPGGGGPLLMGCAAPSQTADAQTALHADHEHKVRKHSKVASVVSAAATTTAQSIQTLTVIPPLQLNHVALLLREGLAETSDVGAHGDRGRRPVHKSWAGKHGLREQRSTQWTCGAMQAVGRRRQTPSTTKRATYERMKAPPAMSRWQDLQRQMPVTRRLTDSLPQKGQSYCAQQNHETGRDTETSAHDGAPPTRDRRTKSGGAASACQQRLNAWRRMERSSTQQNLKLVPQIASTTQHTLLCWVISIFLTSLRSEAP